MNYEPWARIFIRYGVGLAVGRDASDILALDPDLISVVAVIIGALVEAFYIYAKKRGWAT